ncbi:MAG: response regulator [Candidatus Omnitrophica bacterium]|nr:response regulator [Candidatus Omnitrophota bacterium]MDD5671468.1 response regulator [Candidatus Omnitrophota bacterium]
MQNRILIIDDEPDICQVFKELIEFEDGGNFEVDYVTTAAEAFEKLDRQTYGILFVDIKLGGTISGIDIIKHARGLQPRPVMIVISAIPGKALQPVFEKEGVKDLIHACYEKTDSLTPDVILKIISQVA